MDSDAAWGWEDRAQRLITRQRILHSSPDEVFRALESYGKVVGRYSLPVDGDEDLEKGLAARNHPLINLALARNASSLEVLAHLYGRSKQGTGDADQDRAVRLACLANRVATAMIMNFDRLPGIDEGELRRIAHEGEFDELKALFGNPACRALLRDLYEGKSPFDDVPANRKLLLVQCSVGNEAINRDDSDENGPDLTAWDVQDALFQLVRTAPLEPNWVRALHSLLMGVNPARAKTPQSLQEAREAVGRWRGLRVPQTFRPDEGEEDGYFTQLSLLEEFRCLVAALYGRVFENKKFEFIGGLQDEDLALRCAAYARMKLTVDQMHHARERDGAAFVLAALFNSELFLDRQCRGALEAVVPRDLEFLYKRRCEHVRAEHKWFDPSPVSEDFEEDTREQPQPADAASVRALATEVSALKALVASSSKQLFWGLIILGGLLLWRH
jgi:hypothetical protein